MGCHSWHPCLYSTPELSQSQLRWLSHSQNAGYEQTGMSGVFGREEDAADLTRPPVAKRNRSLCLIVLYASFKYYLDREFGLGAIYLNHNSQGLSGRSKQWREIGRRRKFLLWEAEQGHAIAPDQP